jgi:hypothetical protein
MYCIKCGSIIPDASKFCLKCGHPLAGNAPQAPDAGMPGPNIPPAGTGAPAQGAGHSMPGMPPQGGGYPPQGSGCRPPNPGFGPPQTGYIPPNQGFGASQGFGANNTGFGPAPYPPKNKNSALIAAIIVLILVVIAVPIVKCRAGSVLRRLDKPRPIDIGMDLAVQLPKCSRVSVVQRASEIDHLRHGKLHAHNARRSGTTIANSTIEHSSNSCKWPLHMPMQC